jgi:hypothetical protein
MDMMFEICVKEIEAEKIARSALCGSLHSCIGQHGADAEGGQPYGWTEFCIQPDKELYDVKFWTSIFAILAYYLEVFVSF